MTTTLVVETRPGAEVATLIATASSIPGVKATHHIFPDRPELQQFFVVDVEPPLADHVMAVLKCISGICNVDRSPQRKTMTEPVAGRRAPMLPKYKVWKSDEDQASKQTISASNAVEAARLVAAKEDARFEEYGDRFAHRDGTQLYFNVKGPDGKTQTVLCQKRVVTEWTAHKTNSVKSV